MLWLPVVLITSILSSSGVSGVTDYGQPITFYENDTVGDQWDIYPDQEHSEDEIDEIDVSADDVDSNSYEGNSVGDTDSSDDRSVSDNNNDFGSDNETDPERPAAESGSETAAEGPGDDSGNDSGTGSGTESTGSYDDTELRERLEFLGQRIDEIHGHTDHISAIEDVKYDLLTYICGILVFFLLIVILKYIYKFFRIFF